MAKTVVIVENPEGLVLGYNVEVTDNAGNIKKVKRFRMRNPNHRIHRRRFKEVAEVDFIEKLDGNPAVDEKPVFEGVETITDLVALPVPESVDPVPVVPAEDFILPLDPQPKAKAN